MNREIKFRAWTGEDMLHSHNNIINDSNSQLQWFFNRMRPHTKIMQYTGLKDKNGKEIYEGDILDHEAHAVKSQMVWHNKHICFAGLDNGVSYYYQSIDEKHITILGNIYESPELLKA